MLAGLELGDSSPAGSAQFVTGTQPMFSGTVTIYDKIDIGSPSSAGDAYAFSLNGAGYSEGATGTVGWVFKNVTTGNLATLVGAASDIYEFDSVGGWKMKVGGTLRIQVTSTGFAVTGALGASGAFGVNGASVQTAVVLPAAATDLASVITLANAIRSALIANGIGA